MSALSQASAFDTGAQKNSNRRRELAGAIVDLSGNENSRKAGFVVPREVRRLYGPIGILIVWSLASGLGLLSDRIFPAPWAVVEAAISLTLSGVLQQHLGASLNRVAIGLAAGLTIGVALAAIAGTAKRFEDTVDSVMQILKAIPNFTLVPLLIIWMGIGDEPKITLIILGVSVPVYINTYSAIRNVDGRLIESATMLGLNYWERVWHIVLPGAMPGFLTGLRYALTSAWLALVFAETINARYGLGSLMYIARDTWQLNVMVLVITIYAVFGLLSYTFVRFLERKLLAWRFGYEGE